MYSREEEMGEVGLGLGPLESRYVGYPKQLFWLNIRLRVQLSYKPIAPVRSQRDCGSLSGCRCSMGSVGVGNGGSCLGGHHRQVLLSLHVQLLEE